MLAMYAERQLWVDRFLATSAANLSLDIFDDMPDSLYVRQRRFTPETHNNLISVPLDMRHIPRTIYCWHVCCKQELQGILFAYLERPTYLVGTSIHLASIIIIALDSSE